MAAPAPGGGKRLTLEAIYDPEKKADFTGAPVTGLLWLDDGHYLWPKKEGRDRPAELLEVDARSGQAEPLFEAARLEETLKAVEGVTPEEAKRAAHQRSYVMSEGRTALLLEIGGDLYHYDLEAHRALRLTRTPGKEEEPSLSPDGKRVAFVRENNLYVVEVAAPKERALTADGSPDVLNGKLDWVYQEEVYGRGTFRAYWWSPDSTRLAFLRLDEKAVPRYTLVDDLAYHPAVETYPYPKAGDPNPAVRLGVAPVAEGPTVWVDLSGYDKVEPLLVEVCWAPDSRDVVYQVQDREQTWLDLDRADAATGRPRTVLRETSPAWVEPSGNPRWLKDGGFLWLSERTGWKHLYRYRPDGRLTGPLTEGRWEVRTLHGVDEAGGWVYYSGTERSPLDRDVYRVKLDGGERQRLSQRPGTHSAEFSPDFTWYLDTWSDVTTPPQVRLHEAGGGERRVIDAGQVPALREYALVRPEFLQVKTGDGFVMEAMLLRPPGFDPSRKYPVFQHTYGGPHTPQVRNGWDGTTFLFHQLLAQEGIVVWLCDNRSASGKGVASARAAYKRLGESELADIEDGLRWLKKQGWVDPARIGISGWSYGGFLTTYALTHSKSFAMGIAGGPVTDWRDYDTIYTERYMLTPAHNPEGYRLTAPRAAARDLHGRLLLLHGAIDDNVHPQNTTQMAYELQKAGKPFQLMLYPKARHGVTDPYQVKHLRAAMLEFIQETLLGGSH